MGCGIGPAGNNFLSLLFRIASFALCCRLSSSQLGGNQSFLAWETIADSTEEAINGTLIASILSILGSFSGDTPRLQPLQTKCCLLQSC
ncbi:hypothetical protein QBC35DRAFT_282412 [Podospora australis]|uniref:Secreted protein n=1 Tax=Podospora australis TaxID=1536484 RepID=A0AAN6WRJ0_9PEZI|nr:hypothetical protein QBC35DRAFT_282412 [Podospora australis]